MYDAFEGTQQLRGQPASRFKAGPLRMYIPCSWTHFSSLLSERERIRDQCFCIWAEVSGGGQRHIGHSC